MSSVPSVTKNDQVEIRLGRVKTPLGQMVIGSTAAGVCFAEFTSRDRLAVQLAALRRVCGAVTVRGETPVLEQARDELERYFEGSLRAFTVPLVYPGTDFQRAVWDCLRRIPYGATRSYQSVAGELGRPAASRAVGTANGVNRLSIFVPCHRLVNTNGRLGGYGGGLWRKQALLALEQGEARPSRRT